MCVPYLVQKKYEHMSYAKIKLCEVSDLKHYTIEPQPGFMHLDVWLSKFSWLRIDGSNYLYTTP